MAERAVVVAHPDDEVLWAGGWIQRNRPCDVICCSVPRRDPERAIRFFKSVRVLGGYPILIPFVESAPNEDLPHLDLVDLSGYTLVATHGPAGEYGHHHHRQVCRYVQEHSDARKHHFLYAPAEQASMALHLEDSEVATKLEALRAYDHCSSADGGLPKWQALIERYQINPALELFT